MITFQEERWETYYRDCQELWKEHYEEIGNLQWPMEPDSHHFQSIQRTGQLFILTSRENGVMRGYFLSIIKRHPHYPVLCSFEDSYFMSKTCRGRYGIKLLRESERLLKLRGVKASIVMTKKCKDVGKIWERLGYKESYSVFVKEFA